MTFQQATVVCFFVSNNAEALAEEDDEDDEDATADEVCVALRGEGVGGMTVRSVATSHSMSSSACISATARRRIYRSVQIGRI